MRKLFLLLILSILFSRMSYAQSTISLSGYPIVTTGWTVGGSASAVDSEIVLTTAAGSESGYVYYNTSENLSACGQFAVDFDWQITSPGGIGVADGLAFFFINPMSTFTAGGGLGLPNPLTGLILTFDTYDNDGDGLNPENELYGFTTATTYAESLRTQLLCPINGHNTIIDDGSWHHCHMTYNGGTIHVFWDYSTTVVMSGTFPITSSGYFGFSGGTGGGWSKQSVKNVNISYNTISAIVGPTTYCTGSTSSLGDSTIGGTWLSTNTSVAAINTTTGSLTAGSLGTSIISYSYGTGCVATTTVTVLTPPAPIVVGASSICNYTSTTFSDATLGGTWSSAHVAVGTVSTGGVVTGLGAGSTVVTYSLGGACYVDAPITVYSAPGPITGTTSVCTGFTTNLSDVVTGGVWSSSASGIGSVNTSGVVTGVTAGTAIISYSFGSSLCTATTTVTVNQSPSAITGTPYICPGTVTLLADGMSGGTWSSSHTSVATAGSTTGNITGVAAGSSTISYVLMGTGCYALQNVTVYPLPLAINGITVVCVGQSTSLTDATTGGTWSTANASVATVGGSGSVLGVSQGTTVITYTLATGCYVTTAVLVNPLPGAIFGTPNACVAATSTLADGTAGGTWSSSDFTIASVGSTTGVVSGVVLGSVSITYTLTSTGCLATTLFTVNPTPDPISGITTLCLGTTSSLTDIDPGGTWTSNAPSVAPVGLSSGIVTGLSTGIANITFTLPTGCYNTVGVTVYPNPGAITGTTSLCVGTTITLGDATGGGGWVSGDGTVATVNVSSGAVSGHATGTAIITYTLSTGCYATTTVTVESAPGPITGTYTACIGNTAALSNTVTGGTWASSNTAVGTVGLTTGVVTGVGAGTAIITYSLGGTCRSVHEVTVFASPLAIGGASSVCVGSSTSLTDGTSGGTWSSSTTAVGTVSSAGSFGGVSSGTSIISYKLADGCFSIRTETVNATPTAITGNTGVCIGSTITLGDGVSGGTWSTTSGLVTLGTTTGAVTGVTTGTAIISYLIGTCQVTATVAVNPLPAAITGTTSVCALSSTTLADASGAGTWSSSATGIATVGSATGVVSGIAAGTAQITFKLPTGCIATTTVTVSNAPALITGPGSVCTGDSVTLLDATTSGTWTSGTTAVATVGTSGVVDGIMAGTSVITYSLGGSCIVTKTVTVYASPGTISGAHALCVATSLSLGDIVGGGTWVSSATGTATIGLTSGTVTGVALGTTLVTYTAPGGCQAPVDTISVSSSPTAILGPSTICLGATVAYNDGVAGGTWVSGSMSVATIGSLTGAALGVSLGSAVLTYSLGTGCTTTKTITVISSPASISGTLSICVGGTTDLSDLSTGTWSSRSVLVGTVTSGGTVSGVSAGTTVISYTIGDGCAATVTLTVSPTPPAFTGALAQCSGDSTLLSDGTSGGTWSSSNTAVASVGSGGMWMGVSAGSAVISYTLGGACSAFHTVTVYASPSRVSGASALCVGTTAALGDAVTGGTWFSSNTSVATVTSGGGVVTGVMLGTTIITYTAAGGCQVADTLSVSPTPTAITGVLPVCVGATLPLGDGVSGGTWISTVPGVATIGSLSGIVTGVSVGTTVITYSLGSGCTVTATVSAIGSPAAISGPAAVCVGSTVSLSSGTGGTWSGSNALVGTVSGTGVVTGVSAGTFTISYTIGDGCRSVYTETVSPVPAAIGGIFHVCAGSVTDLTDVTSGGTWGSSNTAVGTIGLSTGVLTGVSSGSTIITYMVSGGCNSTATVTVDPSPGAIVGPLSLCALTTAALTDGVSGGTWSSSNTAVGTVSSIGTLYGVSAGTTFITYTLPAGCTAIATATVNSLPAAVTGTLTICAGQVSGLSDATTGGTWVSGNTGVATVGLSTGTVTGVAAGSAVITYTLGGGCSITATVTVNPAPAAISGLSSPCAGTTISLTDVPTSGTWSSGNTAVGTIGSVSGIFSGITSGTTVVTYTLAAGCTATAVVAVRTAPGPIMGSVAMCLGTTTDYTDVVAGTWTSSNTSVATVGLSTGVVTAVSLGTATITETAPSGCTAEQVVTVEPSATAIIVPPHVCDGSCYTLTDAVGGGSWTSTSTGTATISASGLLCAVSTGTTIITYSLGLGCTAVTTVTVLSPAAPVTGTGVVCAGSQTDLSDVTVPGTWSSGSTGVATVVAGSGVVTGVAGGTAMITYTIGDGCTATYEVTVDPILPISGALSVCVSSSVTLSDGTAGGSWTGSDAGVATVDPSTGIVTGVSAGSTVITYTLPTGCMATHTVTVNGLPNAITGTTSVCLHTTTGLVETTGGGTWLSGSAGVATVGVTGIVSGVGVGTSVISYRLGTGCMATDTVTVDPLPVAISGVGSVCVGSAATVTDATTGGTWSSSGAAATVSSGGVVTGVSAGTVTITYTTGAGCIATATEVVHATPAGISGVTGVCVGAAATTLSDGTAGGTWTSSNPGVATVTGGGAVTPVSSGTTTISYTLSTGCQAVLPFTVVPDPGPIGGDTILCNGMTATLTDGSHGGVWTSSNPSVLGIDPTSGVATAYGSGTVLVFYTEGTGCQSVKPLIVNPFSPIDGPGVVCAGQSIQLSDTTTGGSWTVSGGAATVAATGDTTALVYGVSAGTATVSYILASGCTATSVVTVAPSPGAVTAGSTSVCAGSSITLTDGTSGGAWTSADTAIAIVSGSGGSSIVTGISSGTVAISYSLGGCPATITVTVDPDPAAITGATGLCAGSTAILGDATSGGSWSGSSSVLSVSTGGDIRGLGAGTATVTYSLGTGCLTTAVITVNSLPGSISGNLAFCIGSTTTLSDGSGSGGKWSSSDAFIAPVGSASGVVTGSAVGTAVITYTLGTGCTVDTTVQVLLLPPPISGSLLLCPGTCNPLTDGSYTGGTWTSGSTGVATINAASGVACGVTVGVSEITYSLGAGCTAYAQVTVNPLPAAVTGDSLLCSTLTATLSDATDGGTWSSAATGVAVIDPLTGVVTGVSAGTAAIDYTISATGCSASYTVSVLAIPTPFTGDRTVCVGSEVSLTETVAGGTWYSSNTSVATVGSTGDVGLVTGISLGTAGITYSLVGAGPGCSAEVTVTVVPLPDTFAVSGGGSYCEGGTGVTVGLSGSDAGTNYILYRGSVALGAFAGTGFALNFGLQTIAGSYTVEAINTTTGCTRAMTGSATVSITPTVVPAVAISSSATLSVCAGASVTYTAIPAGGGSTPSYLWEVNGTEVGTGLTYTYIPAGGDVVEVVMHSVAACAAPDTAIDTVVMTVMAKEHPYVSFTAAPGDTVCAGIAVVLTADPVYGGTSPSFTWSANGTEIGTGDVFSYIPSNGDIVTCFMTSDYPCLVTDTVTGPGVDFTVVAPVLPSVVINAYPGTSVGIGGSVTLTAEVTNGGTSPTYQWYINSIPVPGATDQVYTHSGFDTTFEDSVSVVVTSSGICPMSAHNWVYIECSGLGVKNVPGSSDISVLPNPSQGTFTVRGTVGATSQQLGIEVTDLLGQVVYTGQAQAPGGKVNERVSLGSGLANGMYLLTIKTETGNLQFHIVVEQ